MAKIVYIHDVVKNTKAWLNDSIHIGYKEFSTFLESNKKSFSDFSNMKENQLLLTFDDGYKSFTELVLPLLEKHNIPVILFVTYNFIADREVPYELSLEKLILSRRKLSYKKRILDTSSLEKKASIYKYLINKGRHFSSKRRDMLVKDLFSENNYKPPNERFFINFEELKMLDHHPLVTIGSHSLNHLPLSGKNVFKMYREIYYSKRRFEALLGRKIDIFSYPYGSHNIITKALLAMLGYTYAFATSEKEYRFTESNYSIPRIDFNNLLKK